MTSTEVVTRTPLDLIVSGLRSEKFQQQVAYALPTNYPPERFARIAITAIQQSAMGKPEQNIALCNHDSILNALLKCAADGLLPDGREAVIVKRGDIAVYQPMVGGVRKIAAEYGWTVTSRAVYSNDEFEFTSEPPTLFHKEVKPGQDRGKVVAAYAIAKHPETGRQIQKVLQPDEIAERRALATTKAVWDKWPAQMAEKSAVHDIYDELPLAEADRERLKRILYASEIDPAAATTALYGSTAAAIPPAVEAPPARPIQGAPSTASGDVVQQADGEAAVNASPSVPGSGDTGAATDDPNAGKEGYNLPQAVSETPLMVAAREAAQMVPPTGVHADAGRTLEQIQALGADGTRWINMALRKDNLPERFAQALAAFCEIYVPDVWAAVQAERGTEL